MEYVYKKHSNLLTRKWECIKYHFWCIILGTNGKGEYNQHFHGFKAWMDPILKFVRSKIKQLAKQLKYGNFAKK